ncbi:M48 family metalloprotease [bacterium]|nr:M48 family metalloprotease [bacterium]
MSLSLGASPINVADLIVDALGQPLAAVLGRLLILWSLLATTQFLSQTWWLRRRFLRTRTAHHCNGLQFWITPGFASMAFGIFRPEVILSQRDAAAPTVERDAVLAHELAHIERNDPLKSWLLGLLLSLVPFVLPLRWLVTHVRNGFEGAADELAVARGVSARSMAATLFKRAQPRAIHWAPSLDGGALYERIVVLLDKAEGRPPQEKQGSKILLGLSMLFILGVHWM